MRAGAVFFFLLLVLCSGEYKTTLSGGALVHDHSLSSANKLRDFYLHKYNLHNFH